MTQPQQHYDVTDDDFDFIWKNIDSPLVVRDRINVIKTRSHPPSERDKVLDALEIPFKELLKAIGTVCKLQMALPGDYNVELGEAIQVCFDKFGFIDGVIAELRQKAGD